MTIKAIAISDDAEASDVSSFTYQFAEQVAMPKASQESGQLEMDTTVSLSCETPDAVIYYTTNGIDPDTDNLGILNVYSDPITISRPVTLKAVAVKNGMQESKVLTVGYTVKEAIVKEEEADTAAAAEEKNNQSGRLQSRRTFESDNTGPSFEDIILKNSAYGVIVASEFKVIPDTTELEVNRTQADAVTDNIVKQNLGDYYGIESSYDIVLRVEGEEIQPDGEIEIGLPIPSEYENALIYVVHTAEDGTLEVKETRRSGGVAYAKVSHLSTYSIAVPTTEREKESGLWKKILLGAVLVVVAAAAVAGIIRYQRKKYYDR